MFFALILNDLLKGIYTARTGKAVVPTSTGSRLRSIIVLPTDYGLLCLIFVTLGFPPVFFVVYSLLFVANAGYFALAAVKWFRDMAALDTILPSAAGGLATGDTTTGAATEGAPTDVH